MTGTLSEMIARAAQPGRVVWLGCRPSRRADMIACTSVRVSEAGLDGDHGRAGKRAVTLIQFEHLAAIGGYLGQGAIGPERLRRNIVVAGLNLAGMRGRLLRIGTARLAVTVPCAPCSRMEETLGHGGYAAVRGHGGWCASVVQEGTAELDDPVWPAPADDRSDAGS